LAIAERHTGRHFKLDDILFDLQGRSAGMPVFDHITNTFKIRINRTLLEIDPAHVIDTTLPHEVAHLMANQLYGVKISPHGQEWKSVMVDVFGLQPGRCQQIDTSTPSAQAGLHGASARGCTSRRCEKLLMYIPSRV
jgi:SprT protein